MLSVLDIRGAYPYIDEDYLSDEDHQPITSKSRIELPEVVFENFDDPALYTRRLRFAFDALWNGAGYAKSPNYNDDGDWIANAKATFGQ